MKWEMEAVFFLLPSKQANKKLALKRNKEYASRKLLLLKGVKKKEKNRHIDIDNSTKEEKKNSL